MSSAPVTQYVAVEFKHGGRQYTYHFDGHELFPGDRVKVTARDGDGWSAVTVMSVTAEKPPYVTKPILGRVEDAPEPTGSPTAIEDDDDADLFGGQH